MVSPASNTETALGGERWYSRLGGTPRRGAVIAGVVAFLFYFVGSWTPSYSNDESITATSVIRNFGEVLKILPNDAALEPYYLALNLWTHVSTAAVWLRLPSVIAMALATALLYRLLCELVDRRLAVFATVAMILMPATTNYAHEIRPYALGIGASVGAVLAWYFFISGSKWQAGVWYGTGVATAALMHAYTLLLVAALLSVALVCYRGKADVLKRTLVPPVVAVVMLSPYLFAVATHAKGAPSRRDLSLDGVVQTALITGVGRQFSALASLTSALFLLLALGGFIAAVVIREQRLRSAAVLGFSWAVIFPVVLTLLQAVTGAPGLVARYWAFSIPGIAIGAGLALYVIAAKVKPTVAVIVAVLLAVLVAPTQLELRSQDGHFGMRWTLLPEVVNLPALQSYPLVLPAWLYESTLANANGQIPTTRFPFWEDLRAEGRVYQREILANDPRIAQLPSHVPGVILYSYGGATTKKPPSAAAFSAPEQQAIIERFPDMAVSCSYFGDALAVFVKTDDPMPDPQQVSDQIAALSPSNIHCAPKSPQSGEEP